MMRTVLFSLVVAAAACGGKSTPATSSTATEPAGNPDGEKHEHHFPAEVGAFHDKLAPLWHADAGQARTDQTCTATGELDALAANVAKAPAPAGVDTAAWSTRATALQESITKLSAACGDATRATFDADFAAVHDAFHALIELIPSPEMKGSEHHG